MNLIDLQHLLALKPFRAISAEQADAILAAAAERCRVAHVAATIALEHGEGDLRPALRQFIRTYGEVHGRSAAEQVAAFVREGNELFAEMALRAWGLDMEA